MRICDLNYQSQSASIIGTKTKEKLYPEFSFVIDSVMVNILPQNAIGLIVKKNIFVLQPNRVYQVLCKTL